MNTSYKLITLLFTAMFLFFNHAQAQDNADINVTATVMETLTITGVNDLVFGDITQGQNKTVVPTDALAGRFDITGEAGSEVGISFTLPTELDLTSGPDVMGISFSTTSGIHHTVNDAGAGTTYNPGVGATTTLDAGSGQLFVFIGGEVQPSAGQFPGNYEGTITLTVEYTGN